MKRFAPEAMTRLQHYAWPGNVRELHNVVERLLIMAADDTVTAHDVGFVGDAPVVEPPAPGVVTPLAEARDRFEREYILHVLATITATSRARPTRWASSAAISTRRCAPSGSPPPAGKPTNGGVSAS